MANFTIVGEGCRRYLVTYSIEGSLSYYLFTIVRNWIALTRAEPVPRQQAHRENSNMKTLRKGMKIHEYKVEGFRILDNRIKCLAKCWIWSCVTQSACGERSVPCSRLSRQAAAVQCKQCVILDKWNRQLAHLWPTK